MFKSIIIFFVIVSLNATTISKDECNKKNKNFIYAGNECIEYRVYKGEIENKLNVIIHGTWDKGTNILGRYASFAENISFETDITTVAVALPSYSKSSSNNIPSLKDEKNIYTKKVYIDFLKELIKSLKEKFKAKKITYVGHSAGCSMGILLAGNSSNLINNILCAGGNYENREAKDYISINSALSSIDKNTKIVIVYGTKDKISKPKENKKFYNLAKKEGLNIQLVEAKNAVHLDLDMTEESIKSLIKLVQ